MTLCTDLVHTPRGYIFSQQQRQNRQYAGKSALVPNFTHKNMRFQLGFGVCNVVAYPRGGE